MKRTTPAESPARDDDRAAAPGRAVVVAFCASLLAALAAYSNTLDAYFLSDDFAQIGRVLEGDLSATWGREHGGFFRPLFVLSLAADAALWNRAPLGYHLVNVTLHALNSSLVFLLSLRLASRALPGAWPRRWTAASAAAIFLLHPSHTEAVAWVSGRADILATLFCLLSLLAFDSYDAPACNALASSAPAPRRLRLAASLAAFALALLSKESAVSLPLVVFLLAWWARRGGGGAFAGALRASAPFLVVLAAYVAARSLALGALVGGYGAGHHLNFSHSMIVSQLLRFPLRALFPAAALRSLPFLESRALSPVLIAVGCVVSVTLAAVLSRERGRARVFGFFRRNGFLWLLLALFLASLAPAINLRVEVFTTQGERFLYLPTVFSSLALAHVASKLARRSRALAAALLLAVLSLYAFALWKTNAHWREASRISRDTLAEITRLSGDGADLLILNLPDNFAGAHLFRNGVPEALSTFQDERRPGRVHILAWHSLPSAADGAELTESEGLFTLRLAGDRTAFERFNEPPEFLEVLERTDRLVRFRLRGEPPAEIFYFGRGRVAKLVTRETAAP